MEVMIPVQDDISSMFERLKNYILLKDKEWPNKIIPAKQSDIDILKRLVLKSRNLNDLPLAYKIFLENMGGYDNQFFYSKSDGTSSIQELIDYHNNANYYNFEFRDPNCLEFFIIYISGNISINISNQNICYSEEGEIFKDNCYSESFEKYLFQTAFTMYEHYNNLVYFNSDYETIEKQKKIHKSESIMDLVINSAHSNGINKTWFSDRYNYFGTKNGLILNINNRNGIYSGVIMGNNNTEINELSKIIASDIGLNIYKP